MATYNTLGATNPFPAEGLGALDAPTPAGAGAYGAPAFTSESRGYPGQTVATGRRYSFTIDPERERQLEGMYAGQMSQLGSERSAMFDYLSSLEGAEQRGRSLIQSGLGRGVAAAAGQGGRADARMLRQAGLEGGLAGAQFETEVIPGLQLARAEGSRRLLDIEREEAERKTRRMAEVSDLIESLKGKHSGFFETDTRAVSGELLAMAAVETDPEIRNHMIEQAERIRATPMNLFTVA
mgnify:FL=1|tara:strand:+ start:7865 stop:8578 length:714 start_codon:yes stop_codon:yes gene_type:complete